MVNSSNRKSKKRGVPAFDLLDAVVVVTGGGSGIGKATAEEFANSGSIVVVIDKNIESAEKTAAGVGGYAFSGDVSNFEVMKELSETIKSQVGVPKVLVNNAGVAMTGHFLEMSRDDWDWILGINLNGVINGCLAFGPEMTKVGEGHIVNMSSGLGYFPRSTESAYVTSKAGVLAFSQSLRADWFKLGIGVSAICPGIINTPIIVNTKYVGSRSQDMEEAKKVFGKGHSPKIVAKAVRRAVLRNEAVVPVGVESWLGWVLNGMLPSRVTDILNRSEFRGV